MITTSLVVELVVIGVGAITWVGLLALALCGHGWLLKLQPFTTALAIPALAAVYVLGIVSDRMIDALFGLIWGNKLRRKHFPDNRSYHEARCTVLTSSGRLAELIEYSRSRLRICRGWSVHALLIAAALNLYAAFQLRDAATAWMVHVSGTLAFGLLGVTSWLAWRNLSSTQYLKVREQARFLKRRAAEAAPADAIDHKLRGPLRRTGPGGGPLSAATTDGGPAARRPE